VVSFWETAIVAFLGGFVLAFIVVKRRRSEFEENLLDCVCSGKQVILAVDNRAHVFTMENGRVIVKQAEFHALQTEDQTQNPPE
jgi:hypothetical protein